MEWTRDEYTITDDRAGMRLDAIKSLLDTTYWAAGRSMETVEAIVANSLCFGMFHKDRQIGFARVVTDGAAFSWLCDVVLEETYRNKGLGSWMMDVVLAHPKIAFTEIVLRTNGSESLYARKGFKEFEEMTFMGKKSG